MSLYDQYATDLDAENNGKLVEFRGGACFRIRSFNSDAVRTLANRLSGQNRAKLLSNDWVLPPKEADAADVELCARAIVVGWENISNGTGEPLPYSVENCRKLMTELPALRREIIVASRLEQTFRKEVVERMEGNS